jgi:hypothetical protein
MSAAPNLLLQNRVYVGFDLSVKRQKSATADLDGGEECPTMRP